MPHELFPYVMLLAGIQLIMIALLVHASRVWVFLAVRFLPVLLGCICIWCSALMLSGGAA